MATGNHQVGSKPDMENSENSAQVRPQEKAEVLKQFLAAGTCSLVAFMYGNAVGWSSAGLPQLEERHGGGGWQGWVGGTFCLGALASSPLHGPLADKQGRKTAGFLVAATFTIHWLIICFADAVWLVLLARAIGGIGASGAITIPSLYNSEVAEPHLRAALGGLMALLYTLGILFAYMMGAWSSFLTTALTHLGTSLVFLPAWWLAPESPAYLLLLGRDQDALSSFKCLRGSKAADGALAKLRQDQAGAAKPASLKQFLQDPAARRGLLLGGLLGSIQTFSGIFAVHSYAASIFERAGGALTPSQSTLLYGALMVLGALLPPVLADRAPRKSLLGWSCGLLCLTMSTMGTQMLLTHRGLLDDTSGFLGLLPAIVLSASVFFYYLGIGSVTYIVFAELFTDQMRGVGGAFMSAATWSTSFFLLTFFGTACEAFGDHSVFLFFSCVCFVGVFFCCICLPETSGRSPQQITAALLGKKAADNAD